MKLIDVKGQYESESLQVDYWKAEDVLRLNKEILEKGFNLNMELPKDRLCPGVPGRHFYLSWLERLAVSVEGLGVGRQGRELQVMGSTGVAFASLSKDSGHVLRVEHQVRSGKTLESEEESEERMEEAEVGMDLDFVKSGQERSFGAQTGSRVLKGGENVDDNGDDNGDGNVNEDNSRHLEQGAWTKLEKSGFSFDSSMHRSAHEAITQDDQLNTSLRSEAKRKPDVMESASKRVKIQEGWVDSGQKPQQPSNMDGGGDENYVQGNVPGEIAVQTQEQNSNDLDQNFQAAPYFHNIALNETSGAGLHMQSPTLPHSTIHMDFTPPSPTHALLDIGTGASAIYALLGSRMWSKPIYATEIDQISLSYAKRNISNNDLTSRITLLDANTYSSILPPDSELSGATFALQCCNPPFFSSREEMQAGLEMKHAQPSSICTGSDSEMIYPGGEIEFVKQLINESCARPMLVTWFSSLLGKRSSVPLIVSYCRMKAIDNYTIGLLDVGRTRRWFIAWSFKGYRLPDHVTQIDLGFGQYRPSTNTLQKVFPMRITALRQAILTILETIKVDIQEEESITITAYSMTWSRAARRKAQAEPPATLPILVCRLSIITPGPSQSSLQISWLYGQQRQLFESFANHCFRKLMDIEAQHEGFASSRLDE